MEAVMKFLILIVILSGWAARCDDASDYYYVVELPDELPNEHKLSRQFKVYWNVPTMQCQSKGIPFEDLEKKYGIIQNTNDRFRGEQIAILYDPGVFPALLQNDSSRQLVFRNGGVPQEGDLQRHLEAFAGVLESSIPDKNFKGVGIIDFESWRPIYRQNFGSLAPYKKVSYELERGRHRLWPPFWVEDEAMRRFESAGREFMQATLSLAKRLRPAAAWGYYAYPYCFNMGKTLQQQCAAGMTEENDRVSWLWAESSALFPSLYSSREFSGDQLQQLIRGRVQEALRVGRGRGQRVLPYFWYKYRDGGFFSEKDLRRSFNTLHKSQIDGVIVWGSSNDVNSIEKCIELLNYVENTLGPTVAVHTIRYKNKNSQKGQPTQERLDTVNKTIEYSNNTTEGLLTVDVSTEVVSTAEIQIKRDDHVENDNISHPPKNLQKNGMKNVFYEITEPPIDILNGSQPIGTEAANLTRTEKQLNDNKTAEHVAADEKISPSSSSHAESIKSHRTAIFFIYVYYLFSISVSCAVLST